MVDCLMGTNSSQTYMHGPMPLLPSKDKSFPQPHKPGLALVTGFGEKHVAEMMVCESQSLGLKRLVNATFPLWDHCHGSSCCEEAQDGNDMKRKIQYPS